MRGNRGRDTRPEWRVRRLVHARGLRYRVNQRPLPDHRLTADLVFTRIKIAVHIDGCYWHGCPEHHRVARTNAAFWSEKINGNRERDNRTQSILESAGWLSLRFWEHQDPQIVADQIYLAVLNRASNCGPGSTNSAIGAIGG